MVYAPTLLFFIASGFLSAWLSFSIAYLMLKSWAMVRQDYLLGFPVGFGLLAVAYVMLDINHIFPSGKLLELGEFASGHLGIHLPNCNIFSQVRAFKKRRLRCG